jgi:uncharacterized protein YdiU (UPF0061 family)
LTSIVDPKALEAIVAEYAPAFRAAYLERSRAKLGLAVAEPEDDELASGLRAAMAASRADFTRTFRMLADLRTAAESAGDGGLARAHREALFLALGASEDAAAWIDRYERRLEMEARPAAERAAAMNAVNPRIVLRNHLAQEAIEASEAGDDEPLQRLLAALRRPYSDDSQVAAYDRPAPAGAPAIVVSCSS